LSSVGRRELTPQPSHYLKPLHPKYNRDESVTIEEQWQALQHVVDNWQVTPTLEDEGFPSLSAWIPVSLVTGQRVELKRNPYYWKVDSEGKQLPYIDRAVSGFVEDEEIQLLQLTSGEVDFFLNPPDDPVLYQQQDAGNYNVTQWMYPIWLVWEVDYSYPARLEDDGAATADIDVAKLLTNPQFLRAMALGMDQPRYTEALYPFHGTIAMWWLPDGAAETSWPELAETKARMDEIYEFDPDKANQILDDLGLEKGEDGWRYLTGEDWRQRVEFNGITRSGRPREVVSRLAVEDIERNLGIKINIQASGRRSWFERLDAGRHQINMTASGPMFPSVKPTYHREWYYSNYDRHDLESTDPIYNRIVELDAAIIAETDPEKQRPLIVERIKLTADNYRETFMLTGKGFWPMAMSKDLKNVNQVTMGDDSYHGWPMQLRPETWSY
jgi:peptide/nickel transport system substrate-binding protein